MLFSDIWSNIQLSSTHKLHLQTKNRRCIPLDSVATLKKYKTLDGPLKKPQKTPGQICTDFSEKSNFCWKKSNFSWEKSNSSWEKSNFSWKKSNFFWKSRTFSEKKWLFVEKISHDLFFSHQLWFSNFLPLTDQKLKKQLVPYFLTKNHLLSSKKHCKICIFRGNLTKLQKNHRFFENPQEKPYM